MFTKRPGAKKTMRKRRRFRLRARVHVREPGIVQGAERVDLNWLGSSNSRQSGSNFSFRLLNVCCPRARRASQPCRSLEWRLDAETGPSYAVGSSVSRDSNGAIASYLCVTLPPFMPRPPARHAAADQHRGGGVRARRARRRRRAG